MISERTMRVLEFTRIREMLAEGALTEAGAEKCRTLVPMDDLAPVMDAQAETEEATVILHYVGGLGPGESLEWLMRYHGLLDLPWRRLDCSEEVIVDGRSWTVPSGYAAFVPGMAEQFPGQEKALSAYLAALQEVASGIRDLRADHGPLLRRSAAAFLEDAQIPCELFALRENKSIKRVVMGESIGTTIH